MLATKLARETELFLEWWTRKAATTDVEARLAAKMSKLFDNAGKQLIKEMKAQGSISSGMQRRGLATTLDGIKEEYRKQVMQFATEAYQAEASKEFIRLGLEPKVIPDRMLEKLQERVFEASDSTMERVKGDVMANLEQSYKDGLGIDDAAKSLKDKFEGLKTWESKRVARTEINSAQSQGVHEVLQEHAEYTQWLTAGDDRVRDGSEGDADHASLEGQIVRVDEPYENGLMYPGDASGDEEEYINCFPGKTLVSAAHVKRVYRRLYAGELVTIKTASGHELTGTPNHPVLTDKGWVALGRLEKGSNVLCSSNFKDAPSGMYPDEHYGPAPIEEVYTSFANLGAVERIRAGAVDFHGDGLDGHIDTVGASGFLMNRGKAKVAEKSKHFDFMLAVILAGTLLGFSPDLKFAGGSSLATDSIVSRLRQALALFLWRIGHADVHGFGAISGSNAITEKVMPHYSAGNIVPFGENLLGRAALVFKGYLGRKMDSSKCGSLGRYLNASGAGELDNKLLANSIRMGNLAGQFPDGIAVDNIVDVSFSQIDIPIHVYNLQTHTGAYGASGIIAHNCRCRERAFIIPAGMMAPTGEPWFFESELVEKEEASAMETVTAEVT